MIAILYGILSCLVALTVAMLLLIVINRRSANRDLTTGELWVVWTSVLATGLIPIAVVAAIITRQ